MIKDFIKIFKETYRQYYHDRLRAKDLLKHLKNLKAGLDDLLRIMNSTVFSLEQLTLYLPQYEREHCVKEVLEMFNTGYYGMKDPATGAHSSAPTGYIYKIKGLADTAKYCIDAATNLYKKKNYKKCIEKIADTNNYIKETLKDVGAFPEAMSNCGEVKIKPEEE